MVSLVGGIFFPPASTSAAMCLRLAIASLATLRMSWKAIPATSEQQRRATVRSAGTE
jgi:hypothetical protein